MNLLNPRILDASIRDVVLDLSDVQKAEVLLYALDRSPVQSCNKVMENAVQSLLQVPNLPSAAVERALSLRAKGKLAVGYHMSAQQDNHSALKADPENQDTKATLQLQHPFSPEENVRGSDRPPHFSEEIWLQIALLLPKCDLRSLLFVPHALSYISRQLLFREVDLHLTVDFDPDETEGQIIDMADRRWHEKRNADILTRILVDPHFAHQVRSLNIFAALQDAEPSSEFKVGMLLNALPKLSSLRKIYCSGDKRTVSCILQAVQSYNPRLQQLSIRTGEDPSDVEWPVFKHLTHLAITSYGGSRSFVRKLLAQNLNTLRFISVKNPTWNFPSNSISICHLTQIELNGKLSTDTFLNILKIGQQLESLMLSGKLMCTPSSLFRQHCTALPSLIHFSLSIDEVPSQFTDLDICPAISEFLQERSDLQTCHLILPHGLACRRSGFDASSWGVLPSLTKLRNLAITYPEDLPPALAGRLVPRTVRALTLHLARGKNDWAVFMNVGLFCTVFHPQISSSKLRFPSHLDVRSIQRLRMGMPPLLCYISINEVEGIQSAQTIAEHGFPNVKVVRIGPIFWTVTRSGEEGILELEQWPYRRSKYHATEWLRSLGCDDAIWEGVDWPRCMYF